jgi:hypothetical protein
MEQNIPEAIRLKNDLLSSATLFEMIPPVLVQMTVVHEPSLKLLQFAAHLPPLLGKAPRFCAPLFGELAMLSFSLCEPRKTLLSLWTGRGPSMEPTASHRQLSGTLAGRAVTGLGAAPLARPIGTKSPWNSFFEVSVYHV